MDDTPSLSTQDTLPPTLDPVGDAPASPLATRPLPSPVPSRASLWQWMVAGLRSAFLLDPRITATPSPWQGLLLVLMPFLLVQGLNRFLIDGAVTFHPVFGLNGLWVWAIQIWLGWATLCARNVCAPQGLIARWFVLACWTTLPTYLPLYTWQLAGMQDWFPSWASSSTIVWITYGPVLLWGLAAQLRLTARYTPSRWRLAFFTFCIVALSALASWHAGQTNTNIWQADYRTAQRPRLQLSQEVFEQQQALWQEQIAGISEREPGHANVYGLVFAPYADEDVFLRESTMVARLLEERFDAQGRVLQLTNHASTTAELPWATPLNLQRGIEALAARMDKEQDLLVLYLTSHGASNHELAARHWPLRVPPLKPEDLREALDAAGIRHRVIAISACYSGGWLPVLEDDNSLIMTAADADHTSYGCGRLSELTFFGRAVFDEELRTTHSFETAFETAVPRIQQREIEAGKSDGFSNPQIHVGPGIRPLLNALETRLAQKAPAQQE